jgi:hypothetical protein
VNFGGKPIEPPPFDEMGKPAGGPANRRAELWSNMKKALQDRFALPDSDNLHADITSVGYKYMGDGRLLLEAKEDMRKRGMPSPDEGRRGRPVLYRTGRLTLPTQQQPQPCH